MKGSVGCPAWGHPVAGRTFVKRALLHPSNMGVQGSKLNGMYLVRKRTQTGPHFSEHVSDVSTDFGVVRTSFAFSKPCFGAGWPVSRHFRGCWAQVCPDFEFRSEFGQFWPELGLTLAIVFTVGSYLVNIGGTWPSLREIRANSAFCITSWAGRPRSNFPKSPGEQIMLAEMSRDVQLGSETFREVGSARARVILASMPVLVSRFFGSGVGE